MQWKNTTTLWGGITQLFHWGMLFLILIQYTLAYTMLEMPDSDQKWVLFDWHKEIGFTFLLLVCLRLWWRMISTIPQNSEKAPKWASLLANLNVWILYGLMFSFPISGLLMSIFGGYPVNYFSLFSIPAVMHGPNVYAASFLKAHIWISYCLYGFVGLHILGWLYHHFFLKDNILARMLPMHLTEGKR